MLDFVQQAVGLISHLGYGGLFLGLFLDSFGPPIPSEILIPLATVLVMQGRFDAVAVFVVSTVGQVVGATLAYAIGRYAGEPFLEKYGKYILIRKKELHHGRVMFEKYGHWVILVGRCVPGIRGIIGYPAGVAEMRFDKYLIFTVLGSAVWSLLMMLLGYWIGNNMELMSEVAHKFTLVGIVALLGFIVWYFRTIWMPWFKKEQ